MASLLITGCRSIPRDKEAVLMPPTPMYPDGELTLQSPPAPREKEKVGAQLDPHIWVEGYWVHCDENWVWIPAHTE